ncbi:MAG: helix-turn-helix domain-containing protein [Methylococcales bacterium]
MTALTSSSISTTKNTVTCTNCNLDKFCIPKGLDRFEVGELALLVNRNNIRQKGEAIYHAGSPFRGMIALRSGSAKLVSFGQHGNELIVDFILPGEVLGFDGLATQTYNCTAIALETVNYCHLPAHKIDELVTQKSCLNHLLLQRSCSQFDAQVERMMLNRRSAEERIASFILQISERLKQRGYSEMDFRLSMTRDEIGNHLGIAHETVSRIFHLFQSKQLIEVKSKHVKIIDKKELFNFYTTYSLNSPK